VMQFIRRFVVVTDAQLLVIALWVIVTHLWRDCEQVAYLSVTSPEKQCGKTRVLETLEYVVARPWRVIAPSDAVAYRYIDAKEPTLLLDEVDQIFKDQNHNGMVAILNAGHRAGARVPRAKDFGKGIEEFDCFCPKALAGIGTLPDTVADRSIYIRLERKPKTQKVERLVRRDVASGAARLRERLKLWAMKHGQKVGHARPAMPEEISDRMEEGCEALVAVADALGWGALAREALVELLSSERLDSAQTMRQRMVRDLKVVWDAAERAQGRLITAMSTAALLDALIRLEESPWSNYYGRGSLESKDLADLLKPYNVRSTRVKVHGNSVHGYRRDQLYGVWISYLDGVEVPSVYPKAGKRVRVVRRARNPTK
jgi:hypothetical protein